MAQSTCQRGPILFTDQWLECSRVVKRVLDVIYTLEVGEIHGDHTNTLLFVLDFAKKWDIAMINNLIVKELRMWSRSPRHPAFAMFLLSIKLGHHGLTAEVLRADRPQQWWENGNQVFQLASLDGKSKVRLPPNYESEVISQFKVARSPGGVNCPDLGGIPHRLFVKIPPTVVWVMLRAQHMSLHDAVPMDQHFEKLLNAACECRQSCEMLS